LISHSPLYVYLGGSVLALFLSFLLFILVRHYDREKVFSVSFLTFGILVSLSWYLLSQENLPAWIYMAVRALFYGIFVVCGLEFWLLASDSFTNFEARRRFPLLISAGILGGISGGFLVKLLAVPFHAVNFIAIWGGILIFVPPIFLRLLKKPKHPLVLSRKPAQKESLRNNLQPTKRCRFGFDRSPFFFGYFIPFLRSASTMPSIFR
jgi:MFS family permease